MAVIVAQYCSELSSRMWIVAAILLWPLVRARQLLFHRATPLVLGVSQREDVGVVRDLNNDVP